MRRFAIAWAVFAATACKSEASGTRLDVSQITRLPLHSGVELVEANLTKGGQPAGLLRAIYAQTESISLRIAMNTEQARLRDLEPGALAIINGGFFTVDRRPTGLLVSEGRKLSSFVAAGGAAGSGVLVWDRKKVAVLDRQAISAGDLEGLAMAIQAGPRIIEPDGRPGIRSDDGKRGHRTVAGVDRRGRLVVAIVLGPAGPSSGPTLYELMHVIGEQGLGKSKYPELSFATALNLDGGPSTGMHVRHPEHARDAPEAAPVLSAIVVEAAR